MDNIGGSRFSDSFVIWMNDGLYGVQLMYVININCPAHYYKPY